MSVSLMSATFKAKLPDTEVDGRNVAQSTLKIVLLALADKANDQGESIYPSIDTLAAETGLTDRSVQRAEEALQKLGILKQVGFSKYGTKNFSIIAKTLHGFQGGESSTKGGESSTKKGVPDSPDPSFKPALDPLYIDPIVQKLTDYKFKLNANAPVIIQGWKDDFKDEIILRAIEDAHDRGKNSVAYVEAIIIGWKASGVPPTREERIAAAKNKPRPNQKPDLFAQLREIAARENAAIGAD